jgi:hypothetical protein
MAFSNVTNIPLPLAVWLATDGYDFRRGERKAISATALLQSPRRILLGERLDAGSRMQIDVADLIASRLGHSIHDGIERAWRENHRSAMKALGYPENLINRVTINPDPGQLSPDAIPVYLEQRVERELLGYTITGKFDMILEGVVNDFKSTSVYSYISGSKDKLYQLQGSIYRWLNPDKATADHMAINFVFTDWAKAEARRNPNYPQSRVQARRIELLSLVETEAWIRRRLRLLEAHAELPEPQLPRCTDEELWRSDPVWKFYLDPAKAQDPKARSSRNFDNAVEAFAHRAEKGRGVVVEVPGQPRACQYCAAFPICSQKDEYDLG